ncbi:hypothetical protein U6B65_08390 [Oscillospiraceae bacterium MB08-C2-2]|nr:hypothetical protein U6B65_08390 [Oscillospiraceae bacterium MB08-C2-2]
MNRKAVCIVAISVCLIAAVLLLTQLAFPDKKHPTKPEYICSIDSQTVESIYSLSHFMHQEFGTQQTERTQISNSLATQYVLELMFDEYKITVPENIPTQTQFPYASVREEYEKALSRGDQNEIEHLHQILSMMERCAEAMGVTVEEYEQYTDSQMLFITKRRILFENEFANDISALETAISRYADEKGIAFTLDGQPLDFQVLIDIKQNAARPPSTLRGPIQSFTTLPPVTYDLNEFASDQG